MYRKGREKIMLILAIDLQTLSSRTSNRVFVVLQLTLSSWIKELENLVPNELETLWD
jgi:hypothetical protein